MFDCYLRAVAAAPLRHAAPGVPRTVPILCISCPAMARLSQSGTTETVRMHDIASLTFHHPSAVCSVPTREPMRKTCFAPLDPRSLLTTICTIRIVVRNSITSPRSCSPRMVMILAFLSLHNSSRRFSIVPCPSAYALQGRFCLFLCCCCCFFFFF